MIALSAALAAACFAQHAKEGEADSKNPLASDPKAVEAGGQMFRSGCAGCHGPEGQGGRGPNLRDRVFWHSLSETALFDVIRKGVGTMPGSTLPDPDVWRLVSFVRSLTAPAYKTKPAGDAELGARMFWGEAGCSGCHRIGEKGGLRGPNLTRVGLSSTVPKIRESIVSPGEEIVAGYAPARVVLRNGTTLSGVARNHTNYSLQLQLDDGTLRMLDASAIESLSLKRESFMPGDFRTRLPKEAIDGLVAFLAMQTGEAPKAEGGAMKTKAAQ